MDEKTRDDLIKIVGKKNFTDSLIDLISYSRDASEHNHRPLAAVWPTKTEQIMQIMELANREMIPVTPRGAGTGLSAGAVPGKSGIVLDLCRMNQILEVNIPDRLVVLQPGVVYADLEKALAPYGFFFPPDPSSGKVATLGGNVAVNAGGLKGAKYGTTKDYVLGLEVVLPDGRRMRTGSRTMKSVSGYDLTKLFVGSEGTLGVITEITLKINPKPPETSTALATFDHVEQAGQAVSEIMYSGIIPCALEFIDQGTLSAIKGSSKVDLPDAEATLLVETDGYTKAETSYQLDKVLEIFEKNNASLIRKANNRAEADELWAARKSAFGALSRIDVNLFAEDVAVPMSKLPDLCRYINEAAAEFDLKMPTAGHAGDGNLHFSFCINASDPDQMKRMDAACDKLFRKVVDLGGTIAAEHGVGAAKAKFLAVEHDEVAMQNMRDLKRLYDPNNILNPGKMSLDQ